MVSSITCEHREDAFVLYESFNSEIQGSSSSEFWFWITANIGGPKLEPIHK